MATKKKLPFLAASADGSIGLQVSVDGKEITGYVDGNIVPIGLHAARALACRMLNPGQLNQLIRSGFLPAKKAVRNRLALLPIDASEDGIFVGTKAGTGIVTVFGQKVFEVGTALNKYATPWGQFKALRSGAKRIAGATKAALEAQRERFRGDLLLAWDGIVKILAESGKGFFAGFAFGIGPVVVGAAAVAWLVYGGGAASIAAAGAGAAAEYQRGRRK